MNRTFKEKDSVIVYLKFLSTFIFTFDIIELFSIPRNSEVQNDATEETWMLFADIKVHLQRIFLMQ